MADSDQALYTLRYNQVSGTLEGAAGMPVWNPLVLSNTLPDGLTFSSGNFTVQADNAQIGILDMISGSEINIQPSTDSNSGQVIVFSISGDAGVWFGECNYFNVQSTSVNFTNTEVLESANDSSALVQIDSTVQGFLPTRMTTTQKDAISAPAEGLIVYDLTLHALCVYDGSAWKTITAS